MERIKIFVSYKDKHTLLKNDIIIPIQTGRTISDEVFKDMIGDDTGDNISEQNPRYCELTAQYWVWKHYEEIGNPEYVGFMHYRRQFIFDETLKHSNYVWLPTSDFYFVKSIYNNYMKHFSKEKIYPYLENTDCIVFKKINIYPVSRQRDMEHHFYIGMPAQKAEVFKVFENVMKEYHPEYYQTFLEFKNNTYMHCCNSFIMKKEVFMEYSEFLFKILAKVDSLVDYSNFNKAELRFLGFIGEYLLTIFVMQKCKNPLFKIKELSGTFVSKEYKHHRKRYVKYKILSKLTFGKKKRYYLKKLARIKKHIK